VRSLLAITHQDGLVFHAAVVIVAQKQLTLWGPVSPSRAASRCLADPGEVFSDSLWGHRQKTFRIRTDSLPSGAGGNGLVTEATDPPSDGASAAT